MAFDDIAVDQGGMAGLHGLGHAELRLDGVHVGFDNLLDRKPRFTHTRRPFTATTAGWAFMHRHFAGGARPCGADDQKASARAQQRQTLAAVKIMMAHRATPF